MSESKFDKKEALAIFKFLNMGGVLSVVVIAAVVGAMYATGCGPIVHSKNWGETNVLGHPDMQDHPEAMVADDHADDHHGDEAHGDEGEHADEAAQ